MEVSGDRLIEAPRQKVWDALNDPATLQSCIPGCETIEKISATEMNATGAVKLGPMAARYNGKVLLSDLDPPNGYTISCKGEGGNGGHAQVTLADEDANEGGPPASATASSRHSPAASRNLAAACSTAPPNNMSTPSSPASPPSSPPPPNRPPCLKQPARSWRRTACPRSRSRPAWRPCPPPPQRCRTTPAAHVAHPAAFHPPPHEDHDHDPSNPHYFGLPIGVIIAGTIAAISVGITLLKFIG